MISPPETDHQANGPSAAPSPLASTSAADEVPLLESDPIVFDFPSLPEGGDRNDDDPQDDAGYFDPEKDKALYRRRQAVAAGSLSPRSQPWTTSPEPQGKPVFTNGTSILVSEQPEYPRSASSARSWDWQWGHLRS